MSGQERRKVMKIVDYWKETDKKIKIIAICGFAGICLLGIFIFYASHRLNDVVVEGNSYYTDDEIKDMILNDAFSSNTLLIGLIDLDEKAENIPFIQSVSVKRLSRNKIAIQVSEKKLIGYVQYLDGYMYFDESGIVQESTTELLENIPYVEGLFFDSVVLGEKLPVSSKSVFNTILTVTLMCQKNEIVPDRIVFDEEYQITLFYGDIEVNIGEDDYLEEKITRLAGILPKLEGKQGLLHLENVNSESIDITFEQKTG